MSKTFYLTTPLYYVNGEPHVGHMYTTVIADAIARYKRMCGLDVCFLTGTDEHGLKIERAAKERGMTPQDLTDKFSALFADAWDRLDIQFDEFIRTTESRHARAVAEISKRITESGFIYPGEYSGNYCVSCEAYVPEGEKQCPDCGRPTEYVTEESYFFKLSAFEEKLIGFYKDNPNFVIPTPRMNEITSFVKGGLRDISISRTSFKWGIQIPDDPKHIFYVWFDALTGYLSGIGFAKSKKFDQRWPADVQLIGKDILRFHAVYWPAFLMAAGLEPPRHILTNGWWTVDGEKMSKSRGNFVTAKELSEKLPSDYIKYFLLREIPVGGDGDFSYKALVRRVNSDLANDIGNLANRTLKMVQNYFDGKLPEKGIVEGGDQELVRFCQETVKLYRENFDGLQINKALDNVWELISVANQYLDSNKPWILARDRANRDRLGAVLYNAAETVRVVALLLAPVVPDGVASILKQLGVKTPLDKHQLDSLTWGQLSPGTKLGKVEAVFPRLELEQLVSSAETPESGQDDENGEVKGKKEKAVPQISIEEFAKVEMRVGRILNAERVPKSSKLLKLSVDLGYEKRQVVAGIGKAYGADELVGRLVAVVTNLKPAKLMGVESNGMIVAASEHGKPVLATFSEDVVLGSRLT